MEGIVKFAFNVSFYVCHIELLHSMFVVCIIIIGSADLNMLQMISVSL